MAIYQNNNNKNLWTWLEGMAIRSQACQLTLLVTLEDPGSLQESGRRLRQLSRYGEAVGLQLLLLEAERGYGPGQYLALVTHTMQTNIM